MATQTITIETIEPIAVSPVFSDGGGISGYLIWTDSGKVYRLEGPLTGMIGSGMRKPGPTPKVSTIPPSGMRYEDDPEPEETQRPMVETPQCPTCGKRFPATSQLNMHLAKAHKPPIPGGFKCSCGSVFDSATALGGHVAGGNRHKHGGITHGRVA